MDTVSELARRYARMGIAVLPLHWPVRHTAGLRCSCGKSDCESPAKHPFAKLAAHGLRDASKDQSVVDRWFKNSELNVGIATGAVSGIVALDIDPRHGGDEALAALEREHGPLAKTWRFLTGGGGEHIIFQHPGNVVPNSAGKIGPGIDMRGDGGYIVAPPSRHISGRPYAISVDHHPEDVVLAPLPTWLLAALWQPQDKKVAAKPPAEWRRTVASIVVEGERNRTMASLAGHLLRNRIDPWVTIELLQAWNRTRCEPPLGDNEIMKTVRSIARREVERRERRDAR